MIAFAAILATVGIPGCGSGSTRTVIIKTVVTTTKPASTPAIVYMPGSTPVPLGVARHILLGSTVAEVEHKLGPPGRAGDLAHGKVHCLVYNLLGYSASVESIQFCFQHGALVTIASKIG